MCFHLIKMVLKQLNIGMGMTKFYKLNTKLK